MVVVVVVVWLIGRLDKGVLSSALVDVSSKRSSKGYTDIHVCRRDSSRLGKMSVFEFEYASQLARFDPRWLCACVLFQFICIESN